MVAIIKPDEPGRRYKATCYKCQRSLFRTHFDIVLGAFATFLCLKCAKQVMDFLEKK